ncbi:MAG: hypothetical protein HW391_360 [Chloroflexi bacterium]|nr:hypothetical protein [Chloroflexota bacterium]
MDLRDWRFPEPAPRRRFSRPNALRDPLRTALLGGLLVMVVGALLPWMQAWLPYQGFFEISGFEGAGDAGLVLELGLIATALTWSDRAWNSRLAILVAGPVILGVICLLVLRIAYTDATIYLRSLEKYGGYGSLQPAFVATIVGAAIASVAGAVQLRRARRRVSFNLGLTGPTVAGTIGGVAGAIGGFIAGVRIAELITAGDIAGVSTSVLVIMAFSLAFVGAWVGAVGASSLARGARR